MIIFKRVARKSSLEDEIWGMAWRDTWASREEVCRPMHLLWLTRRLAELVLGNRVERNVNLAAHAKPGQGELCYQHKNHHTYTDWTTQSLRFWAELLVLLNESVWGLLGLHWQWTTVDKVWSAEALQMSPETNKQTDKTTKPNWRGSGWNNRTGWREVRLLKLYVLRERRQRKKRWKAAPTFPAWAKDEVTDGSGKMFRGLCMPRTAPFRVHDAWGDCYAHSRGASGHFNDRRNQSLSLGSAASSS